MNLLLLRSSNKIGIIRGGGHDDGVVVSLGVRALASSFSSLSLTTLLDDTVQCRFFSSSSSSSSSSRFRPRRRPSPNYRPKGGTSSNTSYYKRKWNDPQKGFPVGDFKFTKPQDRVYEFGNDGKILAGDEGYLDDNNAADNNNNYFDDDLDSTFGPLAADVVRKTWREQQEQELREAQRQGEDILTQVDTVYDNSTSSLDTSLRFADYLTSAEGSTEELVGERKLLAREIPNPQKRQEFLQDLQERIREYELKELELEPTVKVSDDAVSSNTNSNDDENFDPTLSVNPNQLAHGPWGELVIRVDRTTKLWRGGRLESYRALTIGGNLNGCGGFGIGKAFEPIMAVDAASRHCKRNIYFVDRYQNNGLTTDLVGKQNSCRVYLRTTQNGLRGNDLVCEILKRFGITNCVAKSHGNRNQFNVVRATFKALLTHETLEEIAMKRGKRFVSLDRTKRLRL